ncbi:unnamed protein product [Moneuplotes crassus]|uniref:Acyl-coenzyme A oxidase n=1 Tax=Euplotes crassus TaxID=5936 RepID=A0AAD1X2F7_EUPCR|nr:unnamed protein product [Moneuplotes crassus]
MSSGEEILKTGSIRHKRVHHSLLRERSQADFDPYELKLFIFDSEDMLKAKESADKAIEIHDVFRTPSEWHSWDREEKVRDAMRKIYHFHKKQKDIGFQGLTYKRMMVACEESMGQVPVDLHYYMFVTCIKYLASDEQKALWLSDAKKLKMHGCYAQTEMGHGSNIAGLETTATFDRSTDEFVIHTPSLSAYKFWPGELGKFATHAIVFAKLIIDGTDHGVQSFLVEIRDKRNHCLLPGVIAGDIGPKYGFNMKDNGYMALNHVRIPRTQMLSRYSEVSEEGVFTKKGNLKILYTAMQTIRILIVRMAFKNLSKGLTIAIRYGIVRTQFKDKAGSDEERAIIDYQTHQFKLIPILSQCYAFLFVYQKVSKDFSDLKKRIKAGDLTGINDLHTISSGMKAFYTWMTLEGLETCRQSCGGAGYSMFSGLPGLVQDYAAQVTYEGDNTVMAQQGARFLVKSLGKMMKGETLTGWVSYLNKVYEVTEYKCKAEKPEDFDSLETLEEMLVVKTCFMVGDTCMKMMQGDEPMQTKWNEMYQQELVEMSKAHTMLVTFQIFRDGIKSSWLQESTKKHLCNLCKVFAAHQIYLDSAPLFECGYFSGGHQKMLLEYMKMQFKLIRPVMLPLIESFGHNDNILNSCIGNSYGDILENQLESAVNSDLNRKDMFPDFEKYMKPFYNAKI